MFLQSQPERNRPSAVPSWQRVRARASWIAVVSLLLVTSAEGQIYDSLDAYPPRWNLDSSDCDARVIKQGHLADEGVAGGACETITFAAANGTEALLVYPIEPVRPLDDLTAIVSVMSARSGARIGIRVRYPYVRNEETRRPVSVVVYGASSKSPGEFASIGVGMIERPMQMKNVAVRREYGSDADLSDAYVDGIVINAYSGSGTTALRMDQLRVEGLIPLSVSVIPGNGPAPGSSQSRSLRVADDSDPRLSRVSAFRPSKITRILQHNGEPLAWVRSLGFDAVLLSDPPDSSILSEAIRSRILIYAPPPSSPDPALQSLLEPVAGWYIGSGEALDSRQVDQTALTSKRLRGWPSRWQRPLVGAPSETWRRYAPLLDAIIDDLPPRVRGVRGSEEVAQMTETRRRLGGRTETAVGIVSMPPESMVKQTEAIADAIGAPRPENFRWHSMWLQTMRSLEATPAAILYRSTRPLSSGLLMDNQRSIALSYVNRMVAMIGPWVTAATPAPPPGVEGAPYRCTRLTNDGTDTLILTSIATRGSEVLAGDGETLDILLTPSDASKTVWRLTHFSAERIFPETTPTGARLQVVSPDAAEIIVLSTDPSVGGRLSSSAQRFARQAGLDRWQLASESVRRTRENWMTARATRALDRQPPPNLIEVAARTLADAEPMYRAGDIDASLRMARRADAWALRSEWQLAEALMPDWPKPTSCPPMDMGAAEIQTLWRPLMDDQGWGENRLASGSLDDPNTIGTHRWSFGRRMTHRAQSEVTHVTRGTYLGPGALRARVSPIADDALPGGYEGTVIQIRGPAVRVPAGKAIRIDAMVRTLGFGAPHQGLLVYDTIGGQEMGVLVRGRTEWTPVRLYRQPNEEREVNVMFELIGAGEATIDEVKLSIWEPELEVTPSFRPIAEIETGESMRR
jgi:hypothetical protein